MAVAGLLCERDSNISDVLLGLKDLGIKSQP